MVRTSSFSKGGRRFQNATSVSAALVVLVMVMSGFGMASPAGPDARADGDEPVGEYAPGELLVKFKDIASEDGKKGAKEAVDGKEAKAFKNIDAHLWKLGKDMDVEKAMKELSKKKYEDVIEYAEPNWIFTIDDFPVDEYRGDLWNFHNIGQTGGTTDADVDMLEVWDGWGGLTWPGGSVVVAVLDTGVDYTHPDLTDMMWKNTGETPGNGIDDDTNGYVDDYYGYDFYNGDGDPMDDHGHGSHCSGVIAAKADTNGVIGIAGMSSNVKIMAVKWLNSGGSGYLTGAIDAINYAADWGVPITSNSWGSSINPKKATALEDAIDVSGALFVASAGNSGSTRKQVPAGFALDNIISVAATNHNDGLASFSNYGSSWVDIGAPGVSVFSCYMDGGYATMSGTSMSAPHVAGAAALVMLKDPDNSISDTKGVILDNAEYVAALDGKVGTDGKLNVKLCLGLTTEISADESPPDTVSTLDFYSSEMDSVTLQLTVPSDSYLYDVRYSETVYGFDWSTAKLAVNEPVPDDPDTTQYVKVGGLSSVTQYTFAIKVADVGGEWSDVSNTVSAWTASSNWDMSEALSDVGDITYQASAIDPDGNPATVYSSGGDTYVTMKTDSGWTTETVDSSRYAGGGVDITHDGTDWIVVYGGGGLMFGQRTGTDSWTTTMLYRNKIGYDWKSIDVYDDGTDVTIGIAFRLNGLAYAEFDGSSWTTTTVDSGAGARYMDLEFDSAGYPGIAYSDTSDGQWLDILMYVKMGSSGWGTPESVLSGTIGYGVQADLEFDGSDNPHIVCSGDEINYVWWDPDAGDWAHEFPDDYIYSGAPTLAVVGSYTYICYRGQYGIYAALWDGSAFTTEPVELNAGGFRICLSYHEDSETLHLGFLKQSDVRYAERDISAGGPEWG